jgi:hypothetical protein
MSNHWLEMRKYLWNRKEHYTRQPGIQYSHSVDLYQSCLRALLPTVPQLGPK